MNITKTTCLLVIAVCLSTATIEASNWKIVQKEDPTTGITEYVDTDSIQEIDYSTRKAWIKLTNTDNHEEMLLLAFTKDGKVKRLDYTENQKSTYLPSVADTWENIQPDSLTEKAYNKIWPVKERKIKKEPNHWERKGEETANRAANRAINKVLRKIDKSWDWY